MSIVRQRRQEKKTLLQKFNDKASIQSEFEMLRESLLHEQSRSSALETEKKVPVRVHPWRQLQASYYTIIIPTISFE